MTQRQITIYDWSTRLLQTAEYARARFAEGIRVMRVQNDIDAAVRGRMQRQEILYRSDRAIVKTCG